MTYMMPPSLWTYIDYESDNMKRPAPDVPMPISAGLGAFGMDAASETSGPAPLPVFEEAGTMLRSSFFDWYYRIHILPATLALGNIAGDIERTVTVWNAFFEPVDLQAFSVEADGVTASSTVEPPAPIPALEAVRYVFAVSGDGSPTISGAATWTIDGVEYVVPITGRRSVLFSFYPDWRLGRVTETLEWKNTLSTSYNGRHEQIMRIRQRPRRRIAYRIRLRDDDARLMDQAVFGWTGRMYGVPLWHEKVKMQADAAQGAETLVVDTTRSSFVAGGNAVLFRSATEFELLDVQGVAPGALVLGNSLARSWPRGTAVIPVAPGLSQERFEFSRALPRHLDSGVDFLLSPADAPLRLPVEPPPAAYRGLELYTGETNWRQALSVGMTARRIVVDGGLGPIETRPRADFPLTTRGMLWLCKTRAAADDLRAFLVRRDGIRVPAWIPSGTEDFVMAQQAELGATALRVKRSQYGSMIGTHPARRDIVLLMRNGDRLPMRVIEANDEGEGTTLTVDTGMPYVIHPSMVKRISFLGCYRLSSDSVAFDWHTPTVCEVAADFTLKVPA